MHLLVNVIKCSVSEVKRTVRERGLMEQIHTQIICHHTFALEINEVKPVMECN